MRAQRSNPESFRGGILDCFVASAPRNDGDCGGRRQSLTVSRTPPSCRRCRAGPPASGSA
ncbi:hypothetical protein GPL20_33610 [Bradyrhizobium cajani]|uniref:Uncharacterized protein n=1 Tax=Bradyrhizobium cajani TaxID=1928661 RepID=A0A844TRT0_9BRAD|nr:hypothetical protein [Bradyrhizobium cajani]